MNEEKLRNIMSDKTKTSSHCRLCRQFSDVKQPFINVIKWSKQKNTMEKRPLDDWWCTLEVIQMYIMYANEGKLEIKTKFNMANF